MNRTVPYGGVMLSPQAARSHLLWVARRDRDVASIDRLTARVVWAACSVHPLARAWRTLAIAGPRGVLP